MKQEEEKKIESWSRIREEEDDEDEEEGVEKAEAETESDEAKKSVLEEEKDHVPSSFSSTPLVVRQVLDPFESYRFSTRKENLSRFSCFLGLQKPKGG